MILEYIIGDLKILLRQFTDDKRVYDLHLIDKVNYYRGIYIQQEYDQRAQINPLWIQYYGVLDATKVNSSDQQIIPSTVCFGKVTLPPVVRLPDDLGVYRIAKASNQRRMYPSTFEQIYNQIESGDTNLNLFDYYIKRENEYFFYPYTPQISCSLIMENPLNGYVMTTENVVSGNIVAGTLYTVTAGNIVYNGLPYSTASPDFTGVAGVTTFIGGGTVKYKLSKRPKTVADDYPIDNAMAEKVIIDILTKDFQIERQQVSDLVNDSQDQLKILSSGGGSK